MKQWLYPDLGKEKPFRRQRLLAISFRRGGYLASGEKCNVRGV